MNRNELTNIIPNNSDGEEELLSVIILQLYFPNLQNLFTCQCLDKDSTPSTISVDIFNSFEYDTSDASCDTHHCLSIKTFSRKVKLKVSEVDCNRCVTILEKQKL